MKRDRRRGQFAVIETELVPAVIDVIARQRGDIVMDKDPCCGNCHYYGSWRVAGRDGPVGACRLRGPIVVQRTYSDGESFAQTWWPEVSAKEWCGDWKKPPNT